MSKIAVSLQKPADFHRNVDAKIKVLNATVMPAISSVVGHHA